MFHTDIIQFSHPDDILLLMSEKYTPSEAFVADRQMAEALKLEASNVSPERQEKVKEITRRYSEDLVRDYGKYMNPDTLESVQELPERVIVLDEKSFSQFRNAWYPDLPEVDKSGSSGTYLGLGEIIIINNLDSQVEAIAQTFRRNFPEYGIEFLKNMVSNSILLDTLAHETVHAHTRWHLNNTETLKDAASRLGLDECGVSFIAAHVNDIRFFSINALDEIQNKRLQFFKSLEEEFGEDVYRVLFGNRGDLKEYEFEDLEEQVLSIFTKEVLLDLDIIRQETADLM